jgi:hypothetical protein
MKNETLAQIELAHKNLSVIVPSYSHYFKCPICLNDFEIEGIDGKVCIGHIIPPTILDVGYTYVCKKCDNDIGSMIEANIVNVKKHSRILYETAKGKSRLKNYLNIDGKKYLIKLSSEDNVISMENINKLEDMKLDELNVNTSEIKIESEVKLDLNTWKRFFFKVALFACYAKFGYSYVINEKGYVKNETIDQIQKFVLYDEYSESINSRLLVFKYSDDYKGNYFYVGKLELQYFHLPVVIFQNVIVFMPPIENDKYELYKEYDFHTVKHFSIKF